MLRCRARVSEAATEFSAPLLFRLSDGFGAASEVRSRLNGEITFEAAAAEAAVGVRMEKPTLD